MGLNFTILPQQRQLTPGEIKININPLSIDSRSLGE